MKYISEQSPEQISLIRDDTVRRLQRIQEQFSYLLNGSGTAVFAFRRKLFYFLHGRNNSNGFISFTIRSQI